MGQLVYADAGPGIEIPDRTLAHLQIVIMTKLRRGESFGFCYDHGVDGGGGRTAIWFAPSIPLLFIYMGGKEPTINRAWLESLAAASNSAAGLRVIPEPAHLPDI